MTEFKPATPQIVPAPGLAASAPSVPTTEAAPPAPGPAAAAVKRIVTSRTQIGVPSTSPPPHLSAPKPAPLPQAKREYAWQRKRALGQRF